MKSILNTFSRRSYIFNLELNRRAPAPGVCWEIEVFSHAEIGAAYGAAFGKKFKENQS